MNDLDEKIDHIIGILEAVKCFETKQGIINGLIKAQNYLGFLYQDVLEEDEQ